MSLFYLSLVVLISCLLGAVLAYLVTRRQLRAAQADAAQGWAEYQEVLEVAARWKRLYYNLQGRA